VELSGLISEIKFMDVFYLILILFLFLNMALAMVRVVRGPSRADRMMTAQLFGTTGVAVLLVLSEAMEVPALRDVALVFVLLAVMLVVCFVRTATEVGATKKKGGL